MGSSSTSSAIKGCFIYPDKNYNNRKKLYWGIGNLESENYAEIEDQYKNIGAKRMTKEWAKSIKILKDVNNANQQTINKMWAKVEEDNEST